MRKQFTWDPKAKRMNEVPAEQVEQPGKTAVYTEEEFQAAVEAEVEARLAEMQMSMQSDDDKNVKTLHSRDDNAPKMGVAPDKQEKSK